MGDVLGQITGGFSLKDLVGAYVDINKAKLASGIAAQDNTIDQLKGTVSLLSQQNQAQLYAQQQQSVGFDLPTVLPWVALAGAAFLVYKLVK